MNNNVNISARQFTIIVFMYTIGTTILIIPAGLAEDAKQDAWIAAVIGLALNVLFVLLYIAIGRSLKHRTIIQYNEYVYGKWLGRFVSLAFIGFSFIGAATVLYYVGNFMTTTIMPETPIQAINILFVCIVVMALRLGLDTISRAGEILFPWVVLLFSILIASLLPEIEIRKVQPVLEANIGSLFKGAASFSGTASLPFIALLMIFPIYTGKRRKAERGFLIGTIVGGLYVVLITFLAIAVMGPDITALQSYPSFSLARMINIGGFFARVEILITAIWFMTIFFKTVFYFYGAVAGLAQILRLSDYRPLVLPSAMILVVYSTVVYPDVVYAAEFDTTVWIPYSITFCLVLPIVTWIIGSVRDRIRSGGVEAS